MVVVNEPVENRTESQPDPESGSLWRHIIMWAAFGFTLLVTVIIIVQVILRTKGFD